MRYLEVYRNERGRLRAEFRTSATSGLAAPAAWLADAWTGGPSMSGEVVTQEKAIGLSGVFAAVYKLAETVGTLPLKVYRADTETDHREEARAHRSWRILHDKPNEYTTAGAFWSTVVAQLALNGNAYLFKQRDELDILESLWILDPSLMTIKARGPERVYSYRWQGQDVVFTADEVTHIMGFSLDGFSGVSRIRYCRQAFGKAIARDRYEGGFYQGGSKTPGVIQHTGRLGPDGLRNLRESFATQHAGVGSMHKPPILEEGATWASTGMSLADMQFVENAQLSLTETAVMFDLPPGELGGMHGGSLEYSTEELNQIRLTRAVIPYTSRIQAAVTSDPAILPQNVMFAEFTLEALMRPDAKTRIDYWQKLKAMGVVTAEYIAARENLPAPPPPPPPPPAPPPPPDGNGSGKLNPSDVAAMIGAE